MITDDFLTERLEHARVDAELPDGAVERLVGRIETAGRLTRMRRRVGVAGVALLGLGGVVVAAPAAADIVREFLAQTGEFCSGECGEHAEAIDLSAPDVTGYVASQYPDYLTLPPGMSREQVVVEVQAMFPQQDGITFDSGIQGAYESVAYCGWVSAWLAADVAGDRVARNRAADALTVILDWPGPMQTSPDESLISLQRAFARAAREGDRDGVEVAAQFNNCDSWDRRSRSHWVDEAMGRR